MCLFDTKDISLGTKGVLLSIFENTLFRVTCSVTNDPIFLNDQSGLSLYLPVKKRNFDPVCLSSLSSLIRS